MNKSIDSSSSDDVPYESQTLDYKIEIPEDEKLPDKRNYPPRYKNQMEDWALKMIER